MERPPALGWLLPARKCSTGRAFGGAAHDPGAKALPDFMLLP